MTDRSAGPLQIAESHFAVFRACHPQPPVIAADGKGEGESIAQWYTGTLPAFAPAIATLDPAERRNRAQLIALRDDPAVPIADLCIAILAWGDMRISNRNHLLSRPADRWLAVAKRVRNGELDRRRAFEEFAVLHQDKGKVMIGMGPAYYTKLIYLLMPREGAGPVGYIMDQWLGRSINLLYGGDVVRMEESFGWDRKGRGRKRTIQPVAGANVSKWNDSGNYERFCLAVEDLAARMGPDWTPDATELALLSVGGHDRQDWRKYVIAQAANGREQHAAALASDTTDTVVHDA